MINRFLSEAEYVHAFDAVTFHSCTVSGFTCSCGAQDTGGALPFSYTGRLIDRMGLSRNFQAVKLVASAQGVIQTSGVGTTAMIQYLGLSLGLQHSATTCSGGFVDWSTGDWGGEQALQNVTTATSTASGLYTVAGATVSPVGLAQVLSTALTTSTSTGYAALASGGSNAIPITGAGRFIRIVVAPHIETTGCAGSNMTVTGGLIFGHPDAAAAPAPFARVFVTSGCST